MDLLLIDTNTGRLIQKLEDEATIELPAGGGVSIVADALDGVPVSFFCNGEFLRTERKRPHAIAGDLPNGKLVPCDRLSPGNHRLFFVAGANHQLRQARLVCKPYVPAIDISPTVGAFRVSEAHVVYVAADGNDAADGSPEQPLRSIAAAIGKLLQPASDKRRKVLALRRGGTWNERITAVPDGVLITAWGVTGARPLLRVPSGSAISLLNARDVTFADLDITTAKVGTGDGGVLLRGCREIRLLGCRVSGFLVNVVLKGANGNRGRNILLDRCVIRDAFDAGGVRDSSGLYAEQIDGLQLLNTLFLRNGWKAGTSTGTNRNHGAYIQAECGPVTAIGNVFALSSSHGLQARSGGTVTDNLFWCNATACSFGHVEGEGPIVIGGVTGTFARNAILCGRDIGPLSRGAGLQVGNALDVLVESNLFADQLRLNSYAAVRLEAGDGVFADQAIGLRKVIVRGNHCCRWSPGLEVEKGFSRKAKRPKWQIGVVEVEAAGLGTLVNAGDLTIKPAEPSPSRDILGIAPLLPVDPLVAYAQSVGLNATVDALFAAGEAMDRFEWRTSCTGGAAARWLIEQAGVLSPTKVTPPPLAASQTTL